MDSDPSLHSHLPSRTSVLVTGLGLGREAFLGRVVARRGERIEVEGKLVRSVARAVGERLVPQPFSTRVSFSEADPSPVVHSLSEGAPARELEALLAHAWDELDPTAFPSLHRFLRAVLEPGGGASQPSPPPETAPLAGLDLLRERFTSAARHVRGLLLASPRVTTTRELDRIAELEADLLVELGRLAHRAAIRLQRLVIHEPGLRTHLEARGEGAPAPGLDAFGFFFDRLEVAKAYALRNGKDTLVRDLDELSKDAVLGFHEVLFDHTIALDTLTTEAVSQYGLAPELFASGSLDRPAAPSAPEPPAPEPVATGPRAGRQASVPGGRTGL